MPRADLLSAAKIFLATRPLQFAKVGSAATPPQHLKNISADKQRGGVNITGVIWTVAN
jgi:hypothetical protein